MDVENIKNCLGRGAFREAESAWMDAIETPLQPGEVQESLQAFVEAGKAETAETLGWAMLEQSGQREPADVLALAKAALLAVPSSEELRKQTAELYKRVHGGREHFDAIYASAGLETGQSPKRALRTLETCLAVRPGDYLANRFDGRVICVRKFSELGEYEIADEGRSVTLEPKLLADEFDLLPADDFRVLQKTDPQAMERLFQKDIASVLISICQAHGGQINSDDLKDYLVPKFLPADTWSGWWSRARTAVRKCEFLLLEGKAPVTILYHPQGRSVEEEFTEPLKKAYHPLDYLGVLRAYVRETSARKTEPNRDFLQQAVRGIQDRTQQCLEKLPGEAFEGALALRAVEALGVSVPAEAPKSAEVLGKIDEPANVIAGLADAELWPIALEALRAHPSAREQFDRLLYLAPVEHLDAVAAHLAELDAASAVPQAAAAALNDPIHHIHLCLWIWAGPGAEIPGLPNRTTILVKLLDLLFEIDHHWTGEAGEKRDARQKVRSALAAGNYRAFQKVIEEIDEHMGAVVKTKIERTDGLAQTVRDKMLHLLRQKHHKLFLEKKLAPWENDAVIWTTQAAVLAREEELKEFRDVKIPANAKQIGEAAAQGDLSENADWEAAIAERDMLMARMNKITGELAAARILQPEDVPSDHVGIGSRVRLRRTADGAELTVGFLGPWDSDPAGRIYSYTTRLGKTLMGKAPGVTLELEIDNETAEYTIEELSSVL
ncbi:MAG: GreA/GreB family elongation factor [Phycisphaerae bacterium]|nr:GreA/GreB family elongation factor [Phycisphaerae bacterium]